MCYTSGMKKFPDGFLWGAATAAHQVEGGNIGSDWWEWEQTRGRERSGDACRHYELYERDFDLARSLHHNAHRLSVEWARVEPQEGRFSDDALKHYAEVVLALKDRGIEPVVTLHHFTNPLWFARDGGWEDRRAPGRFLRYCDAVVRILGKHVRYWITINEPTIYVSHSFLFGVWPPQARSLWRMWRVSRNMVRAHVAVFRMIHQVCRDFGLREPAVSIAQHMTALVPCGSGLRCRFASWLRHKIFNESFVDALVRRRALDFIGLNYYSRQLVEPSNWGIRSLLSDVCRENHRPVPKNSVGWDIYPEGLYELLLKLKKYDLPVMIAENGICAEEDASRWIFIRDHLRSVSRAIGAGVPVTGYLYWSLLDNFEWEKGFGPRFGLVEMNYRTFERKVRPSALKYAEVCRTGVLSAE
ncbi:MAG: Beta-glucosidase A [Candidatus Omnitrophica bacterium ADurb.Bin314]|nr:MAG: Beta-glucosidase A [Candidatus Omnitrophica bacterium ADurb.Bin314]